MENIKTKAEITQKIGLNSKLIETYEIDSTEDSPKKSMWKVSYSTTYPAELCDHTGAFKSCIGCKHFICDNEEKELYHCARAYDRVSWKVMVARIQRARAHQCGVKIFQRKVR